MDGTLQWANMEYSDVMSALRLFLSPISALPRHIADDGEQVLPGLVMVVTLHHGDQVDFLPLESMEMLGGRQHVMSTALANMRQLLSPQVASVQAAEGRPDSVVYALDFAADDPFGASRACDLAGLLTSAGIEAGSRGLLLAVPSWRTGFPARHERKRNGRRPQSDVRAGARCEPAGRRADPGQPSCLFRRPRRTASAGFGC